MSMSSTCVLKYAMPSSQWCSPCIFVISMVTSTSMQTRPHNVSDFRDLVISLSLCLLLFCCHVNLMLQRDPCIFWRCAVRSFVAIVVIDPLLPLFAIMECHSMTQSCSTFGIKIFLADSLHDMQFCQACCSCFIHAMYVLLPWLAS